MGSTPRFGMAVVRWVHWMIHSHSSLRVKHPLPVSDQVPLMPWPCYIVRNTTR